jgi:RluA family pseudouridine synthase
MKFSSTVPAQQAGVSLCSYLAQRFTYHSTEAWTKLVEEGRVLLNGRRCSAHTRVSASDTVSYEPYDFTEPPADLGFTVLHEDAWILAVDKPGNLLVHRAGTSFSSNVVALVRAGKGCAAAPEAAAVNRLDRQTSGVVLLAKHRAAAGKLSALFRAGTVEKMYAAVVHNRPRAGVEVIDAPVGRDTESGVSYRFRVDPVNGKPAVTRIIDVQPLGTDYAVVKLQPLTGRTHQLRLHCAHIGCPIVGDRLYGAGAGASPINRHALHCLSLSFEHPFLGSRVDIEAPVPPDMRALVEALRGKGTETQRH